jgi:hypothetical protein
MEILTIWASVFSTYAMAPITDEFYFSFLTPGHYGWKAGTQTFSPEIKTSKLSINHLVVEGRATRLVKNMAAGELSAINRGFVPFFLTQPDEAVTLLAAEKMTIGWFIHQDVEVRGYDAPALINPVHRQDGAQDVEIFLDPHHVALEIFPVISPYHEEVMIQTSRGGDEGQHKGIETDALLLGENCKRLLRRKEG